MGVQMSSPHVFHVYDCFHQHILWMVLQPSCFKDLQTYSLHKDELVSRLQVGL